MDQLSDGRGYGRDTAVPGGDGTSLVLPFKPFTIAEVLALTGADSGLVERWLKQGVLLIQHGSGEVGLDYMQSFGLMVAAKYLKEGAPEDRARGVLRYLASISQDMLVREFAQGRSWPVLKSMLPPQEQAHFRGVGTMVRMPEEVRRTRLGKELGLMRLYEEFLARIEAVFGTRS